MTYTTGKANKADVVKSNIYNRENSKIICFIPEDIKAAKALLDTPITELKFDIRSQRIISEADIKTLRELLQITSQYGFRKLRDMLRNFGLVSQKKVEKRLKELNVLDVAGNCNLYRYLDE